MDPSDMLDRTVQAAQLVDEGRRRIEQARQLIRRSKKLIAGIDKRLEQSEDVSRQTQQMLMDSDRLFGSMRFLRPLRTARG